VCGTVRFGHPAARSLVALLPRTIVIEGSPGSPSPEADWMQSTLRLIAAEGRELRPGGEAVITRLSAILVIQAIRFWIVGDPAGQTGWLGALQDPRIGRAMSLVHRDPGPALVGGVAGARDRHVAVGVRGPVHGTGGRAGCARLTGQAAPTSISSR
jgi:Cupin